MIEVDLDSGRGFGIATNHPPPRVSCSVVAVQMLRRGQRQRK